VAIFELKLCILISTLLLKYLCTAAFYLDLVLWLFSLDVCCGQILFSLCWFIYPVKMSHYFRFKYEFNFEGNALQYFQIICGKWWFRKFMIRTNILLFLYVIHILYFNLFSKIVLQIMSHKKKNHITTNQWNL
jgi:hypothetical protein